MSGIDIILGIVIGAGAVWWFMNEKKQKRPDTTAGLGAYNKQRQKEKETNKEKILAALAKKNEMTNDDAEALLGISDISAYRYLEELEQEGKITQIGKTGRSVRYRRTQ